MLQSTNFWIKDCMLLLFFLDKRRYVTVSQFLDTVSVYCDWTRWQVGSAVSVSVWQCVDVSEGICP